MRYADIISNDITAGPGFSVTLFSQGCPHKCPGCFNPETWDFEGGKEVPNEFFDNIIKKLHDNNINRRFCVMGGEPLCLENSFLTLLTLTYVKEHSPETELAVWTGYTYEELIHSTNPHISKILDLIDILVDGKFEIENKSLFLKMRGSSNQRIIDIKATKKNDNNIVLKNSYY